MNDTKVNFTLDDVVAKVREVAAERPTYVYDNGTGGELSSCFYRHGADRSEPGCIVGQALDRLGYVVPEDLEGRDSYTILNEALGTHFESWESPANPAGAKWIRGVQFQQDAGKPWGVAVEYADAYTLAYGGMVPA
jgi:hypothetical protein